MAEHNDLGKKGEELALVHLKNKGYKILHQNWRFLKEEIDIIARTEKELVFVEVKTRSSNYFEAPEQSVTKSKQKFLINAAQAYIEKFNIDLESRFDIIAITAQNNTFVINHIEEAFYPTL